MRPRHAALIGLVLCILFVPSTSCGGATWTLCVGVGTYRDASIDEVGCTLRDARSIHCLLTDPERGAVPAAQATLLIGDAGPEPTRAAILEALDRIEAAAGPEDSVIVFFSQRRPDRAGQAAHGLQVDDRDARLLPQRHPLGVG